jgi:hypothetical protein
MRKNPDKPMAGDAIKIVARTLAATIFLKSYRRASRAR